MWPLRPTMRRSTLDWLEYFAVTFVCHSVFVFSIFDIYFQSPVVYPSLRFDAVSAVPAAPWNDATPASRLVLMVADGLRADTLFDAHDVDGLPSWAQSSVSGDDAVYMGDYPEAGVPRAVSS